MEVSAVEKQLLCLPLLFGGLGVFNLVVMSDNCYDSLVCSTLLLCESILGGATDELDAHVETVQSAKALIDSIRKTSMLLFLIS